MNGARCVDVDGPKFEDYAPITHFMMKLVTGRLRILIRFNSAQVPPVGLGLRLVDQTVTWPPDDVAMDCWRLIGMQMKIADEVGCLKINKRRRSPRAACRVNIWRPGGRGASFAYGVSPISFRRPAWASFKYFRFFDSF